MKALNVFLFVVSLSVMTTAFAGKGDKVGEKGREGGGGDVQKSTRADLEEVVSNMQRHLWEVSDWYLSGSLIKITNSSLSPKLLDMTRAMLGKSFFTITNSFYDYIRLLKYEIIDGPCFEGTEEKDASTQYVKNAPICLSASRISRFPKSALKVVLIPIILHEVAHQFGFGENEANAFQALADIHLKYRPIYLSANRAIVGCQNAIGGSDAQALLYCGAQAYNAGENLMRVYDGNVWAKITPTILSSTEEAKLMKYSGEYDFSFHTVEWALREPNLSGGHGEDAAYILMLAAKAAISLIDKEVGRLQDAIK